MAAVMSGSAATYTTNFTSGFANGGTIPDANPSGWADSRTISAFGSGFRITDINVSLNVSGGFNGDLYAYLSYTPATGGGSGFSVLLNRVGRTGGNPFGYGDAGFNITLDDSAMTDFHLYGGGGAPTGSFQVDGRNVDPTTVTDASARTAFLSSFNNLDANGTWTLFFADLSGGDQSTLLSWSLEITAVPEPANVALGIFGGMFAMVACVRNERLRKFLGLAAKA